MASSAREESIAPLDLSQDESKVLGSDVAAKESCIKYVDALWFCYSPVYQTTEFYREGKFDSCLGKWGDMWDCIRMRTSAAPAVLAKQEARRAEFEAERDWKAIWEMRTPEESAAFWKEEFSNSPKENIPRESN